MSGSDATPLARHRVPPQLRASWALPTELEGDGDKIDRPFRGGNNGGKFTKETFQLGEFEHLTGIEIHCSQSVVEAIRFEASTLGTWRKDRKDGMAGAEMFERKRWCGVSKTKTRWSKFYGEVSSFWRRGSTRSGGPTKLP